LQHEFLKNRGHEVIVHGGGVHFAKDFLKLDGGAGSFGKVVTLTENGWSTSETGMFMKSLSQEHGIIHAPSATAKQIKIGDFLGVLPVHSCMTADVMKSYTTTAGEPLGFMR
jgi:D-serine deaminase-like pyridoxal phosphate-dependent protein